MTSLGVIAAFVAVINPFRAVASVGPGVWRTGRAVAVVAVVAAAVTAGVAVALAAGHDGVLDALSVSAPTFRIGAGLVIAVTGVRSLLMAPVPWDEGLARGRLAALVPVAFPVLITPELAVAAVAFAADEGTGIAIAGALVGLAAFAALATWRGTREEGRPWLVALGRLAGAGAVVIGIARLVSGVFDV